MRRALFPCPALPGAIALATGPAPVRAEDGERTQPAIAAVIGAAAAIAAARHGQNHNAPRRRRHAGLPHGGRRSDRSLRQQLLQDSDGTFTVLKTGS
jgi:hypothetical protein